MRKDAITIILPQLLQVTTCNIQQFDIHLSRGNTIFRTFNILLTNSCSLYNLIDSAKLYISLRNKDIIDNGNIANSHFFVVSLSADINLKRKFTIL